MNIFQTARVQKANKYTAELMYYCAVRFIAEESNYGKDLPELTDAPTWIIDPIDGTVNFIHGFPHTCVVIGLAVNKEMVLGIVYNPILEQLFTARKGRGAFLNGKPIHVSKVQGNEVISLIWFDKICERKYKEYGG